jgi:type II secretory pathway predicted ATPase ExeA
MYYETFGLNEPPFQLTPDSRYLYLSKAHRRAKAYMDYAVWKRDGFIVITGEIGAGKTTLINKLLSEIGKDMEIIRIFQTQLNEVEFLQSMLFELGTEERDIQGLGKVQLLHRLNHYLLDAYSEGRHVVLIVDEGQNLSTGVLEEIRMLSGLEVEKEKLLNIILVGQPEMNAILDQPKMEQLIQRIRLRFHVGPLNPEETIEYIHHRIKVAGSENPESVFKKETFPLIQKYTNCVPRKINSLCDTAMVCAFAADKNYVDVSDIEDALEELQWLPADRTWPVNFDDEIKKSINNSTEESSSSPPSFSVDEQHWKDLFSSLLKVIGDVTERMSEIDKKLTSIDSRLAKHELNDEDNNTNKKSGRQEVSKWVG